MLSINIQMYCFTEKQKKLKHIVFFFLDKDVVECYAWFISDYSEKSSVPAQMWV